MKYQLLGLMGLIFVTVLGCQESKRTGLKVVTTEDMQTLLQVDNMQLIDVRTPEEYAKGFIADARNIDFYSPTFKEAIKTLDKKKPVLIYCHSGGRSAKSAKKFLAAGFTEVYDLEGGISKWKQKGLEIKH